MTSTSYKVWLQHESIREQTILKQYESLFTHIVIDETSTVLLTAVHELTEGLRSMLSLSPVVTRERPKGTPHVHIGTASSDIGSVHGIHSSEWSQISTEGYLLKMTEAEDHPILVLIGGSDVGVLYGVFHLLRLMNMEQDLAQLYVIENPKSQLRMINHWDNIDGSVERGYAGHSIFYRNNQVAYDMKRIKDYARMLASVGINGLSINNVNVHEIETYFITDTHLPTIAKIANQFRAYGIRLYLSINFAAPIEAGGLQTADPLDPEVRKWWNNISANIYKHIPDFGGYVVKADSEHRPGPFTYDRDHKDGANMLAEALEPFGGIVIWRCFVYNCMQDWRDRSTDRARAAYDHFKPLDGAFHDNVILQIKNGPMDFQVREPVSPLFGAMSETNQLMEFQITQEYTGQQRHLFYLVPQWKEVLDFDTYAKGEGSTVAKIVDGSLFNMTYSGYTAVANIGDDENWTGHTLAQANLYGYGRLVWNPQLSSEQIADEWIRLTFSNDEQVVDTIKKMLMLSWIAYENYTAPLGVGWMVNVSHHYGPNVDGYEYSRWGTYHFADRDGIGVDRTIETGTGYAAQYFSPHKERYNSLGQCPDELLLFFHHVPYSHVLQSGSTVIQHIYDTHFTGVEQAKHLVELWESLQGKIDQERYEDVLQRQEEQVLSAKEWRDTINTYFYRKSGVPDKLGRRIY